MTEGASLRPPNSDPAYSRLFQLPFPYPERHPTLHQKEHKQRIEADRARRHSTKTALAEVDAAESFRLRVATHFRLGPHCLECGKRESAISVPQPANTNASGAFWIFLLPSGALFVQQVLSR